jgi:hypothetical protein
MVEDDFHFEWVSDSGKYYFVRLDTGFRYDPNFTDKAEFDVVVMGISHTDLLVSVSIDGQTQKYTIHHNPSFISAPTVQQIVFKFARNFGATPPTALPTKTGDIWFAC